MTTDDAPRPAYYVVLCCDGCRQEARWPARALSGKEVADMLALARESRAQRGGPFCGYCARPGVTVSVRNRRAQAAAGGPL